MPNAEKPKETRKSKSEGQTGSQTVRVSDFFRASAFGLRALSPEVIEKLRALLLRRGIIVLARQ
jgi:hypothetical protein